MNTTLWEWIVNPHAQSTATTLRQSFSSFAFPSYGNLLLFESAVTMAPQLIKVLKFRRHVPEAPLQNFFKWMQARLYILTPSDWKDIAKLFVDQHAYLKTNAVARRFRQWVFHRLAPADQAVFAKKNGFRCHGRWRRWLANETACIPVYAETRLPSNVIPLVSALRPLLPHDLLVPIVSDAIGLDATLDPRLGRLLRRAPQRLAHVASSAAATPRCEMSLPRNPHRFRPVRAPFDLTV
jgi:hypothetical protein